MKNFAWSCAVIALVSACKQHPEKSGGAKNNGDPAGASADAAALNWAAPMDEQSSHQLFNLAQSIKENVKLEKLHQYVAAGNAYMFFGDKKTLRAESNLTIDSNADAEDGGKTIDAAYFLDGYALGKNLGEDKGHILDFGATATVASPSKMEAHIRVLGDDKYKGDATGLVEHTFMRDFPFEVPYYPIPAVTLVVSGKVGGEMGLRAELGVRQDNAMQLMFLPRVSLNAGVTGEIKLIEILKAQAEGLMKLVEMNLRSSASLGLIAASNYLYGNIGIDSGSITALDGAVKLKASAGLAGLDRLGFGKLIAKLGFGDSTDLDWSYTLFDPKGLIVKDIPVYSKAFMKFYKKPANRAECVSKTKDVSAQLAKHIASLKLFASTQSEADRKITDSALGSLGEIETRVGDYCK